MIISNCNAQTKADGQELEAHGSPLLPFACYEDDVLRRPVAWHWHDEMEAAVVTEGSILLSAGTKQLSLSAGVGFFINAGCLHRISAADQVASKIHVIVFHPKLVGGSVDSLFWQKYLRPLIQNSRLEAAVLRPDTDWCAAAIENMAEAWKAAEREETGYEFVMRSALSRLILAIYLNIPSSDTVLPQKYVRDNERVKRMLAYIQEHFDEDLTLEGIAKSTSVSKSECLRGFKNIVGVSPIQYVKQYRLHKAAELLEKPDVRIMDVAFDCGFREMSYFTKVFREFKGMTPSEYQKKCFSNEI